jgi:hypothetical protein
LPTQPSIVFSLHSSLINRPPSGPRDHRDPGATVYGKANGRYEPKSLQYAMSASTVGVIRVDFSSPPYVR